MNDLIDGGLSDCETIKLAVKPNTFLYALEATRIYLVMMSFVFLLIPYLHFKEGVPMGRLTLLVVMLYLGGYCILFTAAVILARGLDFIITTKRVILRSSVIGRKSDKISIPIKSIKSVEVRCYDAQHGSVYLKCRQALPDDGLPPDIFSCSHPTSLHPSVDQSLRLASLTVKSGWASIWLSTPSSSPSLTGFYGFKHCDAFATLIVELQAAA
jgi:hypothetical protein